MSEIVNISALEILDSRGNPTLRVEVRLACGAAGAACVPSGASVGSREALELRDDDKRYDGKGVRRALANVNGELCQLLMGHDAADQSGLDKTMREADGDERKARLGANAILGVSLASARAEAAASGRALYEHLAGLVPGLPSPSLPRPMMNILNGGAHASNNVDIQEFMVQPVKDGDFAESLRGGVEIYHALRARLRAKGLSVAVGDEGGFAPDLSSNAEALDLIMEAIADAGLRPGEDFHLALDCAANEMRADGKYALEGRQLDGEAMIDYLVGLCDAYPIASIEDGLDEDDWRGWRRLTERLGERLQLVGDDLFATNVKMLGRGVDEGVGNAILIKPNQIGTLSETLEVMVLAEKNNYARIVSHRSGETEDTTIADLAVAAGAGQIKTGAPCRSDRVAKYNRLLLIEAECF